MKNSMTKGLREKAGNISKRTMAIALAAALILSAAAGAGIHSLLTVPARSSVKAAQQVKSESEATTEKDETVYVIADASGNPQKVIVSDWLKNEQKNSSIASIGDVGNGGYTIDSDNSYSWDAQSGELDDKSNLPVSVKLTYLLDGKEMSAEEIAGKSGKATIRFDYTNNQKQTVSIDGRDADIYVPFTVVTGAVLDDSVFSNIEISNGKVINDGTRSIVIGFALPGMQQSLDLNRDAVEIPDSIEITADVRNFSLTTTLTMVTNDVFNEAAKDYEEKKTEKGDEDVSLDRLTGGITRLADGSSALYDGTSQLLEKSGMLISGINQLAAGGQQVSGGVNTVRQTLQLLCSKNSDLQGGASRVFDTLLSTARKQVQAAGMDCPELTKENYVQVLGAISSGLSEESIRALAEQARPEVTAKVESAVRDNVGGTEDAVEVRALLQKLHHSRVAALRFKIRNTRRSIVSIQALSAQRFHRALKSGLSGGLISLGDADICDLSASFADDQLRQFPHGVVVVVIYAGQIFKVLSGDHQRHRAVLQRDLLDVAESRGHENDPRDTVALHHFQILKLPVLILVRIAKDRQVILLQQFLRDAVHHLIDGFRENSGHDDPDLSHSAGPHGLGHEVRPIAGLLDSLRHAFSFFFAQRSSVEIPADGRGGDPRKPSHFLNCHLQTSFSR